MKMHGMGQALPTNTREKKKRKRKKGLKKKPEGACKFVPARMKGVGRGGMERGGY
jgi:hypothetical protein